MQSIEVRVRKTTPADFQFMWPGNVSYGSDATTYGTIYAAGTISHQGTAYGNLESETSVTGSPTLLNGAKIYTPSTNPSIRTVVTSPIFTSGTLSSNSYFAVSLTDVKRAAGQNSSFDGFRRFDRKRLALQLLSERHRPGVEMHQQLDSANHPAILQRRRAQQQCEAVVDSRPT